MIYLRQSTASQEIPLGHFVDSTDGDTAETALTIANTDIKLHKTGATTLASKNSGGATHISGGVYYAVMDATDSDTIGPMTIFVHVSGALAVKVACCVLDEAVYDVMFGTTAPSTLTAAQVNTEADTALTDYGALKPTVASRTLDVSATGEAGVDWANVGSPTTTLNLSGTTVAAVTGAVGSVTGNVGGNVGGSVASVTAGVTVTTNNDKTGYSLSAAGVDAVWDEAQSGHTTAGTFGKYLDSAISGVSTGGVSAADIADAVWDEARSGHVVSGTFGEYTLADAVKISGSTTAADNCQSFFDGTGYAGTNNVIPTVTTLTGKTGFSLASTGLDSIVVTRPSAVATTFPAMLVQLYYRIFGKTTQTSTQLKTYASNGSTVVTTQTVSDDGTTQTMSEAS